MVQTDFGGPDVVQLQLVPEPEPQAGEVLVRVAACALNRLDVIQRRGPAVIPGFSLPHIAGMDIAGTVAGKGRDVSNVDDAARVVIDPTLGCGSCTHCRADQRGYCAHARIIGGNSPGGLAELVAVPADAAVSVPDEVPLVEAAALPTAWATAWHAVHCIGQVAPGECVVVQAGASAVGLAAIQLIKRAGATVVAVASTTTKIADAIASGADLGVRNDEDLPRTVAEFTHGSGADMVLDHVGAETWDASLSSLAIAGRLVMLGNISGDRVGFSLADVYHRGLRLLGAGAYSADDFQTALRVCFEDGLRLPTAGEFGLEDLPDAWSAVEARDTVGKVIVLP
jgi:NADPH:quinone reductase-like Zn-dependent oxidoreductase